VALNLSITGAACHAASAPVTVVTGGVLSGVGDGVGFTVGEVVGDGLVLGVVLVVGSGLGVAALRLSSVAPQTPKP
jgi:hypothetical protein